MSCRSWALTPDGGGDMAGECCGDPKTSAQELNLEQLYIKVVSS